MAAEFKDSCAFLVPDAWELGQEFRQRLKVPFGTDPTFIDTESLFRASNDWTKFYKPGEMKDEVGRVPYGWFYDGGCTDCKEGQQVHDFPVFFDANMNVTRKDTFVTLLQEGAYLDAQSSKVTIRLPLMSYEFGSFTLVTIDFQPAPGGGWTLAYDIVTLNPVSEEVGVGVWGSRLYRPSPYRRHCIPTLLVLL